MDLHAQVTTAAGVSTLTRDRGFSGVTRAGAGDYTLTFASGFAARASEYHFDLTPIGTVARIVQLGNTGDGTGLRVLAFDAAGAAADADFMLSAERL